LRLVIGRKRRAGLTSWLAIGELLLRPYQVVVVSAQRCGKRLRQVGLKLRAIAQRARLQGLSLIVFGLALITDTLHLLHVGGHVCTGLNLICRGIQPVGAVVTGRQQIADGGGFGACRWYLDRRR
jgi:hypothetical protein